ncbi:MAG: tripartite tricarboxylate transporter TctB family protein [Flavobacteriaceae bacterium]
MRALHRDQIVGFILLAVGLVWTVTVYLTIPGSSGSGIGPRAFPFWLGVLLTLLSAVLVVSGFRKARESAPADEEEDDDAPKVGADLRMVAVVLAIICLYGFLMEKIGFVLATIIVVVGTIRFALGIRRPLLTAGMALGMSLGCWVVFGRILGAYLPPGTWISLF